MELPTFTTFPVARKAFYIWGDDNKREDYLVIGVAVSPVVESSGYNLHHATWLLCIRPDGKACWMGLSQLTFEV